MPTITKSRKKTVSIKSPRSGYLTDEEISDAIEDFLEDHVPPEKLYKKSFLKALEKAEKEECIPLENIDDLFKK